MESRTLLFYLYLITISHVEATNILGIFTALSPSHNIIHLSTVRALAEAGHNVTMVTMLPLKDTNPNYHHLYIPPEEEDQIVLDEMFHKMGAATRLLKSLLRGALALDFMNYIQQKALKGSAFQELINNEGNHFDLVIMGFAFNDFLLGIADHFKCPAIVTSVNLPFGTINEMVGNPSGVSYVPVPWLGHEPMGFFKRVTNMLFVGVMSAVMSVLELRSDRYHKMNFPAELGYRSLKEMRKNVSLVFCSTFFSEGPIQPFAPNFIEIGGIQAKEEPDPLSEDIEQFLLTATDGVIFFSLGSNVKSADLPVNVTQTIFNVLSGRKEKILWKWDDSLGVGKASNIMFKKWFPQDDILANPKIKLFITHGGKGSVTEAQHHGIPMLAIPVFGDQFFNANLMESQGYGLVFNYRTMTEDQFKAKLEEVLNNSTYSKNIKRYSTLYRDRPMSARQSVVYWAEYVIRHHGAKHMQSPRVHLNFFQYNSLDVIGFLLAVLFGVFYFIRYGTRYVFRFVNHKNKPNLKKKN